MKTPALDSKVGTGRWNLQGWLGGLNLLAGTIGLAQLASMVWVLRSPPVHPRDFVMYYLAAQRVAGGESPYDDLAPMAQAMGLPNANELINYLYPPLFAIVFRPLTSLDMVTAWRLWMALSLVFLGLALYLLVKTIGIKSVGRYWGFYLLAIAVSPPLYSHLYEGQLDILMLLLVVLSYYQLKAGRKVLSGIALGLASVTKLAPALVAVYFVMRREFKAASVTVVISLALTILSFAIVGWDQLIAYWTRVPPYLDFHISYYLNESVQGFFYRLLVPNQHTIPIVEAPLAGRVIAYLVSVGIVALTAWTIGHGSRTVPSARHLEFSLVVLMMLLVSSLTWVHQLVFLAIPFLAIIGWLEKSKLSRRWLVDGLLVAALLLAMPPFLEFDIEAIPAALKPYFAWSFKPVVGWSILLLSKRFYGLLLLYGINLYILKLEAKVISQIRNKL